MSEVRSVGEGLGAKFELSIDERVAQARRIGPIRTSMLQDFERGRVLESLPLLDVVVSLGHMTNVATPTLQIVAGLVSLLARGGRA
jgi:2-dehydropantoate 2-reductase